MSDGIGVNITPLGLTGEAALAYASFGDMFPVVIVLMDPDMRCTWASPGARSVLGYEPEAMVGVSVADIVHPDDLGDAAGMATEVVSDPAASLANPAASTLVEFPVRLLNGSGDYEMFNVSGRLIDEQGHTLGVIRPASEYRALDGVIESLGSRGDLSVVLASVADLIRTQFRVDRACVIHDMGGCLTVVPGERGRVCSSEDRRMARRLLQTIRVNGLSQDLVVDGDTWAVPVLSETGESLFGVVAMPAPRPGGPALLDQYLLRRAAKLAAVAFARDRDDRLLRRAATTDYLTGVANRRHFEALLATSALEPGALPLRLLYIDVDDFKAVNDTFGHRVGDEVLAAVAARLRNNVRPGDFVGRLGGDEFAVAAPGMPAAVFDRVRERIDEAIRQPVTVGGETVAITASIGVAAASDEDSLETILERGDDDMFCSKRSGHART